MIKENLSLIHQTIREACEKSNRDPNAVRLIAVSKTKPVALIREAYDCGIRDFGENKVKEILEKKPLLPNDIRWHMIGHLQTNKVRQVIREATMIHSVDSIRLADCIDTEAKKAGVIVEGLLQVNIAGEESKYGFSPAGLMDSLERLSVYRFFKIKGLMTIAPFVKDPEYNRNIFLKLRDFSVDIKSKKIDNISMDFLSMGMTGDYSVAIEEGADYIRIGTALFGARETGRRTNELIG